MTWRMATAMLLCAGLAQAHENEHNGPPLQPGWQVGGGVAVNLAAASDAWPVARHEGVLLTGQTARDRRNELSLEHATVGAAARFTPWLAAQLHLGQHDRDRAHVEVARVEATWNAWRLRARRQSPSLGGVVDGAGHFNRFAQAPLAKQAVFNETWVDDGLTLVELVLVLSLLGGKFDLGFVWITLAALLAYGGYTIAVTEWRTQFRRQMNELDSKAHTRAIDALLNYETVKYFSAEAREIARAFGKWPK